MQTLDFFITSLDTQLYYFQQQLSTLISLKLNNVTPLTFLVLFIAGLSTSLNPCLIAILPLSISYLYGKNNKAKLANKVLFIVGITSSLVGMILISSIFSQLYGNIINQLPIFSSILTVFIGLNLLQILNFSDFLPNFNKLNSFFSIEIFQDYIVGFILGLSSTSCSTPILFTILIWLSNSRNIVLGYLYLSIYCLGYIVPLIILINFNFSYEQKFNFEEKWSYVIPISGAFVLGFAVFSILEKIFI